MANFKTIGADDIQTSTSVLSQLVDVIQEDISGSSTRRKYQVFVTGGLGPGVTSSLFQTVYDQDFSLQTSNAVLDMTIGLFESGSTVTDCSTSTDVNGKMLFPSQSIMMREKVQNYKQFAQVLLGDSDASFYAPGINAYDSAASFTNTSTGTAGDRIEEALFINFKRLFARDELRKETFALKLFASAALDGASSDFGTVASPSTGRLGAYTSVVTGFTGSNLAITSTSGSKIYADVGASATQLKFFGGDVGVLKDTSNTAKAVGLMWYDHGIAVLDMGKVFCAQQHMSGALKGVTNATPDLFSKGTALMGYGDHPYFGSETALQSATITTLTNRSMQRGYVGNTNVSASFIPDLVVSASIDELVDHLASTRFGSGSYTATTFQNVTNINSTLIFCRATADEFNYSSNPTFRNTNGELIVIDPGDDTGQRTFSFVTTVGLYNSNNELLGVAKLSRPVEKNDEKDLTVRVRLDF